MGTWSTSISGNDTAMDLRYEFQAAFYYFDIETALQKIDTYVRKEGFDESDEGEWCNYYYSLADFMWRKGILTETVKNRALEMIDSGFGLDVWEEAGKAVLKERKKILEKFREKLCSEQPAKKKIKINLYMKPILQSGDVVAFQLQTIDKEYLPNENSKGWLKSQFSESFFRSCHGKWVVMRKAYDHISYRSSIVPEVCDIWPHFQLYAAIFDECPTLEMLKDIPWANTKYNPGYGVFCTEGSLSYLKKRNYQIIGSSLENIDIEDKIEMNTDAFFFGSPGDTYNADTIILNAIIVNKKTEEVESMKYSFKFKLFGSNTQMFSEKEMGIVIEKESQVVCVYGTDNKHRNILCAVPLCSPKLLKGAEYVVEFCENDLAKISVSDIQVVIDFRGQKCKNNKNIKCYGSDSWGQDVQVEWSEN